MRSKLKRLKKLFYDYGDTRFHDGIDYIHSKDSSIVEEKFEEVWHEIETEYLQLVRAARKGGAGALVSERKGEETTPERTCYDMGHSV